MAFAAMGTKLKIGTNAVAELTSISGLDMSADTIETTTLDSGGWRTFIQGVKDAGEVSVEGYFNADDATGQIALKTAFTNGSVGEFTIEFPTAFGAKWEFDGVVTAISTEASMEDSISFSATIKVSGAPTLTIS
jgi:predicted secreted protein